MNSATPNSSRTLSIAASSMTDIEPVALQALMLALGAYLSPERARQAAALWQGPSPQGSALAGLSRYCRQVAREFDLQGREAELHLGIIRAMRQLGAHAAPSPSEPVPAGDDVRATRVEPGLSANDSLPPGMSAWAVQRFLECIEQAVAREVPQLYSPGRWRQSVLARAQRIPAPLLQHAADWLQGRSAQLQGDWPARGAGTRLINTAYVALAEWVGPVRADACFTAVVRDFESSQDPALSGVRRYL